MNGNTYSFNNPDNAIPTITTHPIKQQYNIRAWNVTNQKRPNNNSTEPNTIIAVTNIGPKSIVITFSSSLFFILVKFDYAVSIVS